jgi:hypothetical protein
MKSNCGEVFLWLWQWNQEQVGTGRRMMGEEGPLGREQATADR